MKPNFPFGIPPLPPTATHQLIHTKEGVFWRAKRGLYAPVTINSTVASFADAMRRAAPAAKRIAAALKEHTAGLQTGRLIARISGKLLRSLRAGGGLDLRELRGLELQPEYPLRSLLCGGCRMAADVTSGQLRVQVLSAGGWVLKPRNQLADRYRFTAVLLEGYAGEDGGLRVTAVSTEVHMLENVVPGIELRLPLPPAGADWVAGLKAECYEGPLVGIHPGLRAMAILGCGT